MLGGSNRRGGNHAYRCCRGRMHHPNYGSPFHQQSPYIAQEQYSCTRRLIEGRLCFVSVGSNDLGDRQSCDHTDCGNQNAPLYTTPEFSFTVTGAPMISLKKPLGSLASPGASLPSMSPFISSSGLTMIPAAGFGGKYCNAQAHSLMVALSWNGVDFVKVGKAGCGCI
jgi:hypothetical protein